ncbi:unnamed protein product [Allacma fusca]|uniref:Uncharacterized protein n=1 Tax=Allacma fusca TaxID=39272 RepID=A0A8J2PNR8_9HEXA|nr:unnamed protein product [Allacma fusca]
MLGHSKFDPLSVNKLCRYSPKLNHGSRSHCRFSRCCVDAQCGGSKFDENGSCTKGIASTPIHTYKVRQELPTLPDGSQWDDRQYDWDSTEFVLVPSAR